MDGKLSENKTDFNEFLKGQPGGYPFLVTGNSRFNCGALIYNLQKKTVKRNREFYGFFKGAFILF